MEDLDLTIQSVIKLYNEMQEKALSKVKKSFKEVHQSIFEEKRYSWKV